MRERKGRGGFEGTKNKHIKKETRTRINRSSVTPTGYFVTACTIGCRYTRGLQKSLLGVSGVTQMTSYTGSWLRLDLFSLGVNHDRK